MRLLPASLWLGLAAGCAHVQVDTWYPRCAARLHRAAREAGMAPDAYVIYDYRVIYTIDGHASEMNEAASDRGDLCLGSGIGSCELGVELRSKRSPNPRHEAWWWHLSTRTGDAYLALYDSETFYGVPRERLAPIMLRALDDCLGMIPR
jgi:hypothetical protein